MKFASLLALASSILVAIAGYTSTCNDCHIYGLVDSPKGFLDCSCRGTDGGYRRTNLNLDYCVGNNNAHLVAQNNGGWSGTCTNYRLDNGRTLSANCRGTNGVWGCSSLDLDYMQNFNGRLECWGHQGS